MLTYLVVRNKKIAIAALYNGDQIFIFDEATSNLDQNTAKMIVKNICNFLNDKITIFISHQKDHFDEKIKNYKFIDYTFNENGLNLNENLRVFLPEFF